MSNFLLWINLSDLGILIRALLNAAASGVTHSYEFLLDVPYAQLFSGKLNPVSRSDEGGAVHGSTTCDQVSSTNVTNV